MVNLANLAELNPLLTKELRGRMRGWRAIGILTGYLFLLGGVTWLVYLLISTTASESDITSATLGKFLLGTVVVFQFFFVALLAPAFTAGIITGEREKQTYDLLMTTLLRPRSIVLGKMGAALAWLLLLVLAVVPLSSLSFLLGGVALEEVVLSLVVILAAVFFYGAIGLFWSSVMRSTIAAVVLALLTIGILLGLLPVLYYMAFALIMIANRGTIPDILQTPTFLYFNELLLSGHPLYAMGRSEAYLLEGKPIFFVETTLGGADVVVIHPWLVFTLICLAGGTLLIALAIHNLPPVRRRYGAYAGPVPGLGPGAVVSGAPGPEPAPLSTPDSSGVAASGPVPPPLPAAARLETPPRAAPGTAGAPGPGPLPPPPPPYRGPAAAPAGLPPPPGAAAGNPAPPPDVPTKE
jgi:ABC-type transport system involved in multi-copper enzyme maturation permease subunit